MEGIYAHADLIKVYKAILDATQEIATYLRYHSGNSTPNHPNITYSELTYHLELIR